MTAISTPEDCGRSLLAIFGRFTTRPKEMMLLGPVQYAFLKAGFRVIDFRPAIEWLEIQGWIATKGNGNGPYFLTEAGFTTMWPSPMDDGPPAVVAHPRRTASSMGGRHNSRPQDGRQGIQPQPH